MHDPKSIGHIFFNMFAVVIFGTQLERVWGPKKFLGYYIACAFGAAILHQIVIQIEISNLKDYISIEQWYIIKENGYSILNQLRERNFSNLSSKEKFKILNEINNNYDLYLQSNSYLVPLIVKMNSYMLGASGAVFGLLAAFGYLFPNTELMLLFPPIPIKAKYFVIGYAALELYLGISNNPSDNVAHFAHLGGALVGIIIVLYWGKNRTSFF
jgi:membrane associated rhomboid family serine protease